MSFDIKISQNSQDSNDNIIKFNQNASYENFISQFQPFCSKLLCVIDGNRFRYYDTVSSLPNNIRFDHKQRSGNSFEYYFRDNNSVYCVFGREAASILYPNIDNVDPKDNTEIVSKSIKIESHKPPIVQIIDTPKMPLFHRNKVSNTPTNRIITIIDNNTGQKSSFPDINYPIKKITHHPS